MKFYCNELFTTYVLNEHFHCNTSDGVMFVIFMSDSNFRSCPLCLEVIIKSVKNRAEISMNHLHIVAMAIWKRCGEIITN